VNGEFKVDQHFDRILEQIPTRVKELQGVNILCPFTLSDKYFETKVVSDSSIDPNANINGKSPVNFTSEIFKPQLKLRSFHVLWDKLSKLYNLDESNAVLKAMLDGTLYFHDITKVDVPYCFSFDASFVSFYGRPYGWLPGVPPKRSSSFMGQLVETTMDFSQQFAGAIGIANAIVSLAYFTKKERQAMLELIESFSSEKDAILGIAMFMSGLGYNGSFFDLIADDSVTIYNKINSYIANNHTLEEAVNLAFNKHIENQLQQFVHVMHNTFRIGGDSPFTNISIFDREILKTLFNGAMYPDFTPVVNNIDEIIKLQNIFVEFFVLGSPSTNKKYRFPVATINIKKWTVEDYTNGLCKQEEIGVIADKEYFRYLCKKNLPRGTFNWHIGEKIASCCRLTSDLSELKNEIRTDTFGNGGISIGSHRVVALNLHRIALSFVKNKYPYYSNLQDLQGFYDLLELALKYAEKALVAHNKILKDRIDSGFLQFFSNNWCNLSQFFSTIGFTGLWDAFNVIYSNTEIYKQSNLNKLETYTEFATKVLGYIDCFAKNAGKRNQGFAFNVEEIPGENASPKLAEIDNFYFCNEPWYQELPLLSNQMVPLYEEIPLFDRMSVVGKLVNQVSGGAIWHFNLNENVPEKLYEELIRTIIEDFNITHFAINIGSSTCIKGHTTVGIFWECPICNQEIFTHTIRIIGYESDTKDWIKNRREWEWKLKGRQVYTGKDLLEMDLLEMHI
jgi:ribonucleoside-triphosphate reductase